jgi:hypothetical protein
LGDIRDAAEKRVELGLVLRDRETLSSKKASGMSAAPQAPKSALTKPVWLSQLEYSSLTAQPSGIVSVVVPAKVMVAPSSVKPFSVNVGTATSPWPKDGAAT